MVQKPVFVRGPALLLLALGMLCMLTAAQPYKSTYAGDSSSAATYSTYPDYTSPYYDWLYPSYLGYPYRYYYTYYYYPNNYYYYPYTNSRYYPNPYIYNYYWWYPYTYNTRYYYGWH